MRAGNNHHYQQLTISLEEHTTGLKVVKHITGYNYRLITLSKDQLHTVMLASNLVEM